jgi:sec-independent protein translocase protein TatA
MGEVLTPTHLLIVAVVALVLFGGNKLPELGKGLGAGLRSFKDAIRGLADDMVRANQRRPSCLNQRNHCSDPQPTP